MQLQKWDTVLSDCRELYFEQLIDTGPLAIFRVKDGSGKEYEVILENCGPYVVVNEEYLVKYWNIKSKSIGWTFVVIESPFEKLFANELNTDTFCHYVVATMDTCLEVLSENKPKVSVVGVGCGEK